MASSPILVTGTHRSGSTWVGHLLALHGDVFYVQEPFNVTMRPAWVRHPASHWYEYLDAQDPKWQDMDYVLGLRFPLAQGLLEARSPRRVASVLRRSALAKWGALRGRRPLVKDPFMVFNAEVFQRRYESAIVFTVRHPAAFADSLDRRGWSFDFANILDQPELMMGPLQRWEADMLRVSRTDARAQAILLWRVVNGYVYELSHRLPNTFTVVHETFAADTRNAVSALYSRLGLSWTPRIERAARTITEQAGRDRSVEFAVNDLERSSQTTATAWRSRMDRDLIKRIEEEAQPEFDLYYGGGACQ